MAPLVMANKPGTHMRQTPFCSDIFVIHTKGRADSEIWEQMDALLSHGDLLHWIPYDRWKNKTGYFYREGNVIRIIYGADNPWLSYSSQGRSSNRESTNLMWSSQGASTGLGHDMAPLLSTHSLVVPLPPLPSSPSSESASWSQRSQLPSGEG